MVEVDIVTVLFWVWVWLFICFKVVWVCLGCEVLLYVSFFEWFGPGYVKFCKILVTFKGSLIVAVCRTKGVELCFFGV
ncbi:hypothetical protein EMIT0194MI4_140130 [Pseudomonas sp. IT-194MI4]